MSGKKLVSVVIRFSDGSQEEFEAGVVIGLRPCASGIEVSCGFMMGALPLSEAYSATLRAIAVLSSVLQLKREEYLLIEWLGRKN